MADPLEKLEAAVKKLAAEMAEVREGQAELGEAQAEVREDLSAFGEAQTEMLAVLKNIQRTQTALTNAMTSAVKELSTSKVDGASGPASRGRRVWQ